MPAVRAANAFAPIALRLNPSVERESSHQQPATASRARISPEWTFSKITGSCAEMWMGLVVASVEFGAWKPRTVSR